MRKGAASEARPLGPFVGGSYNSLERFLWGEVGVFRLRPWIPRRSPASPYFLFVVFLP